MSDAARAQSGRVRIGVALVAISLAGLIAATYFTGAFELITDFVLGDGSGDAVKTPASADSSGDAQDPAPGSGDSSGTPGGGSAQGASNRDLSYFREWMYWEQIDSQDTIGELVEGKWASFTVTGVEQTASTASLRIAGKYRSGASLKGTLLLRKLESDWYFVKITSEGNLSLGPRGRRGADYGVVKTIVSEQGEASNQAVITGLKDGGYKEITVGRVKQGSRTATIDVTLSGGTKGERDGRIVCVSKKIGGEKRWFITRCEER